MIGASDRMKYARRQQFRRLSRAGTVAMASGVTVLLALVLPSAGAVIAASVLLIAAFGLGVYARHWLSLAECSRIGARSEDDVRRALAPLQAEGWRLRQSLPWRGRGDIHCVGDRARLVPRRGETKTRTYDDRHLARVHELAALLSRRRQRGVDAVQCP
jgi:hypothetical protein